MIGLRGNPAFDTLQPWQKKTTEKNYFDLQTSEEKN